MLSLALATIAAGTGGLELSWSGGVTGSTVDFDLAGDPGELFIFQLSLGFAGPGVCVVPLAVIDPLDPRCLEIVPFVLPQDTGILDGLGEAQVTYDVPNSPAFLGAHIYAQAVTFPGNPTIIDDLSDPVGLTTGAAGESYHIPDSLSDERTFATATRFFP